MHIRDGKDFVIVVSNRKHTVSFLDVGPVGEFLFAITSRDHPYLQSHSGNTGYLLVTIDGTRYLYSGRVSSMNEDRAGFFAPRLIGPERRLSDRYSVPSVPAHLKEKGFLRPRVIVAFLVNISAGGAALSTSTPLETSKVCELDTSLIVHHSPREMCATVSIRYCRTEKRGYVSGIRFEEMSAASRDTLEKFIRGLQEG